MRRFVEGIDQAVRRRCFRSALKTGSTRTIQFGWSMHLSTSSTYRGWGSMEWSPRQRAGLRIILRSC